MHDIHETSKSLRDAVMALRYDARKRPCSTELRLAWPDAGQAWIAAWANELERDASTIAADLSTARMATSDDDALTPLENAAWRLGAAREKLHSVIALSYGLPSLHIGNDAKQTLSYRPRIQETRAKLRALRTQSEEAGHVIRADDRVKAALLLRHQTTHSLAPLIKPHSLTWYEAAFIEEGGVRHYVPLHLPPKGLDSMSDIGPAALRERSIQLLGNGLSALLEAMRHLARLLHETAELEPPQVVWYATEVGRCYGSREEASEVSRGAS